MNIPLITKEALLTMNVVDWAFSINGDDSNTPSAIAQLLDALTIKEE